jgi:CBS-domain-containing membrane protein
MKAKDLMISINNEYLRPETTLKEAVNLFRIVRTGGEKLRVKALPVLDSAGKLIGILTMGDILKAVHPSYLNMMNLGDFTWDGMVEEMAKKAADRKVSEVMTKTAVLTVRPSDALMECVDYLLKQCVELVPVVDADGKVVGIIYERDVFFAVVKAMIDDKFMIKSQH